MKHWTERWPALGPYAVGENRLCLLTRGPLAAEGQMVEGEGPTARPKENDDGLFLHTKPRGVGVTDLSEESVFEAGRYAFAVWSHLIAMKKLSSSRLEGEMGASSRDTFSFSRISVRLSHKWHSAATEPAIERPTARAVCLVAFRAKSVALCSSLTASGVRPVPSAISLRTSTW